MSCHAVSPEVKEISSGARRTASPYFSCESRSQEIVSPRREWRRTGSLDAREKKGPGIWDRG
jgi:hypothetical protein